MRFTIQVCFQIYSSYKNKGALGGRKPPRAQSLGYVLTIAYVLTIEVKFQFRNSILVFSMDFLSTCSAQPKLEIMCSKFFQNWWGTWWGVLGGSLAPPK